MKGKLIPASLLLVATLLLVSCGEPPPAKETIHEELIAEGIKQPEVTIDSDRAVIRYQPSLTSESELLKEWIYIMGTAVEQAPWIDEVVIKLLSEGEEIMEVSGKTEDIVAYLTGKTTADMFLPKVMLRPIGEGPLIKPPGEGVEEGEREKEGGFSYWWLIAIIVAGTFLLIGVRAFRGRERGKVKIKAPELKELIEEEKVEAPVPPVPSQICPNCGASLAPGTKFCEYCGAKIREWSFCTHCGHKIGPEDKFCPGCGVKLS